VVLSSVLTKNLDILPKPIIGEARGMLEDVFIYNLLARMKMIALSSL